MAAYLYRDAATFSDFTIKSYVFKMWLHAYIRNGTTITSASTPCAFFAYCGILSMIGTPYQIAIYHFLKILEIEWNNHSVGQFGILSMIETPY